MVKSIHIQYFAILREKRGLTEETIDTPAHNALDLYQELKKQFDFPLTENQVKVAINNEFKGWPTVLKTGDNVIFIPPVAGG